MLKRLTLLFITLTLLIVPAVYAQSIPAGLLSDPHLLQKLTANSPRVQRAAGIFNVNTTADLLDLNPGDGLCLTAGNTCSLRAAVQEANAIDPGSVIHVPAGTYILSIAAPGSNVIALPLFSGTSVIGSGVSSTIIDGNNLDAVFVLGSNSSLYHLTVTKGIGLGDSNSRTGGGVLIAGTGVVLNDVEVTGNQANTGAGVAVGNGSSANLTNSTIADNVATQGVTPYPFSGGGLIAFYATVTLANVTISGNLAPDSAGLLVHQGSNVSLNNTTIAFNQAANTGGGINMTLANENPAHPIITVRNSIIAENTAASGSDCKASLNSLGDNLIGDANLCFGLIPTDIVNMDAALAPLTLNFPGTTRTHALLIASPAMDEGDTVNCLPNDQRGAIRRNTCDIGAYEFTADLVTNGDFEARDANNNPQPAPWKLKNGTDDRIECELATVYQGSCAFTFTGGAGENSSIRQTVDIAGVTFAAGDLLDFKTWANAANPGAQGKIKIRVKYSDGTPLAKITTYLGQGGGYTEYPAVINLTSPHVFKIRIQIQHTSAAGKIYIDEVRLVHQPVVSGLVPLPLPLPLP